MKMRVLSSLCALGMALLGAGSARAQSQPVSDGEFTIQRFAPAPGPRNFITVEGARTSGDMAWSIGLFGNYAHNPLVITRCTGTSCSAPDATDKEERVIIDSMVTADLLASLTVVPRLQLGLRVPFTYVHGPGIETDLTGSNAGGPLRGGMKGSGLGDAMVEAKARLYGEVQDPVVIGAAVFGTAPIGHAMAEGKYIGDSGPTVGVRGIYDGNAGPLSFAANIAGIYRQDSRLGSAELGPEMRYGLAAGFRVSPVVRIIGEGFGGTKLSAAKGTNAIEALLAGEITPLGSGLSITAGGGAGVMKGIGVPEYRGFLGLSYSHEVLDTDGDGIPDDRDLCPTAAEDFDGFQDEDGCPDPDNDGDGVLDQVDACPNTFGEKDPDPKKNGCPAVIEDRDHDGIPDADDMCPDEGGPIVIRRKGEFYGCPDRDGDGVPDKVDQCPDEPEDTDGFEDEDGCPDPDNDGDGIPDQFDQCIDEPEVYNGFEDEDGCPDSLPDRDGDGIPDHLDKCPDQPENYNGFQDDDGCPDKGPNLVQVTAEEIKILDQVNFANNSDKIVGKRSFEVLDGVAAVLKHHPQIFKIEVQGHTDDVGDAAHNTALSKRRAEAVLAYLAEKGIATARLTANGYGPDKPIADNKSKAGRAKNRRVSFQILHSPDKRPEAAQQVIDLDSASE